MQYNTENNIDRVLTQQDLAIRWGCSARTLQRWRTERSGPAFVRLGGNIRYLIADVIAFEHRNRNSGGQES